MTRGKRSEKCAGTENGSQKPSRDREREKSEENWNYSCHIAAAFISSYSREHTRQSIGNDTDDNELLNSKFVTNSNDAKLFYTISIIIEIGFSKAKFDKTD